MNCGAMKEDFSLLQITALRPPCSMWAITTASLLHYLGNLPLWWQDALLWQSVEWVGDMWQKQEGKRSSFILVHSLIQILGSAINPSHLLGFFSLLSLRLDLEPVLLPPITHIPVYLFHSSSETSVQDCLLNSELALFLSHVCACWEAPSSVHGLDLLCQLQPHQSCWA